jgi:transposase-like protein
MKYEEKNTTPENTPKSLKEAIKYFSNPDTCIEFLLPLRWPNGVTCPNCEGQAVSYISTRRVWKCKVCKKQFSIKVGTIMEDSPLGLDKWLAAIWMIANCKNGISSYEIHRALGITQKSAWFLLHRIRLAMQTGSFAKMSGPVEADETYIGGLAKFMHKAKREAKITGTGGKDKAIVMGILDRHSKKVRAKVIESTDKHTLQSSVRECVEPGAAVMTDSLSGYAGLKVDFVHEFVDHSIQYVRGSVHTNGIENFWSLLKRGLKGTYVSVEPYHLHRYVDEQAFRYNERAYRDADRFVDALKGAPGRRIMYKQLIAAEEPPRDH